jgi:ribulose-bisphosphate carboxylase large chain
MAMREAYDAALSGIDVQDYAKDHPALAAALEAYSS